MPELLGCLQGELHVGVRLSLAKVQSQSVKVLGGLVYFNLQKDNVTWSS